MQTRTRIASLKAASALVIAFGLLIALSSLPSAAAPTAFLLDLIFWPLDGGETMAAPSSRLFAAISGGVMAGWGVLLWLLTTRLYRDNPELARTLITASIGIWFVVDSLGSIAAGAVLNAVFNLVFLELFLIPLWYKAGASTAPSKEGLGARP